MVLHVFGANKVKLQPISRPHMWQTYIHWRLNYGFCTMCGLWEPHPNWSVLYAACKDLFLLSLNSVPMNKAWLLMVLHVFGANKVKLQPISRPHVWQAYIHWRVNYGFCTMCGLWEPHPNWSVLYAACKDLFLLPLNSVCCSPHQDCACHKLISQSEPTNSADYSVTTVAQNQRQSQRERGNLFIGDRHAGFLATGLKTQDWGVRMNPIYTFLYNIIYIYIYNIIYIIIYIYI